MSVNIIKDLVSSSKYNIKCPYKMDAEYITIHNTANDASALNEITYMKNNNNQVSYHFAVDDKEIRQGLPLDRNAWHCGDGSNGNGNRKSIGVEICYSKSGGERYYKAEENAIKLIAQLLKERGWGIERVKKHQDWNKKYCPHRILDEGRWNEFKERIKKELDQLNGIKKETKKKTEEKSKKEQKQNNTYKGNSIVEYLDSIKVDSSFENRKKLAEQHGIKNYKGTAEQNLQLLEILTQGKKVEKSTQVNAKTTATDNRIDTVKEIQAWLNKNYNTRIKEDNIFGSETKKALIKAYQTELNKQFKAGLKVDGIWGKLTRNATKNVKKGAKGNLTKILQATLFCLGYKDVGLIDGVFGRATDSTLRRFQKSKGLASDGIAGKDTWEALFK
jgi:N-acetylmuramoyl-L-alanine amidase CwlA